MGIGRSWRTVPAALGLVWLGASLGVQGATIAVTGVVRPARIAVVNEQQQIIEIASNTAEAVTPEVRLGSFTGAKQPLTPAILQQYQTASFIINLARPGIYNVDLATQSLVAYLAQLDPALVLLV